MRVVSMIEQCIHSTVNVQNCGITVLIKQSHKSENAENKSAKTKDMEECRHDLVTPLKRRKMWGYFKGNRAFRNIPT